MNKIQTVFLLLFALVFSGIIHAQSTRYKCMLQMTNYSGEAAYVVVSLVNAKGQYQETLYVMAPDKKYHKDMKSWYPFYKKKPVKLNAISGASMAGGDRRIFNINIDQKYLNKGYKIRFETAVEDQKYHAADAEIPFTTDGVTQKTEGKGYVRYVKLIKS